MVKRITKRSWYEMCHSAKAMKMAFRCNRPAASLQLLLVGLLTIGIVTVALSPRSSTRTFGSGARRLFTITEGDYLNPLLSSARAVTVLNCVAQKVARFAGYDDFNSRIVVDGRPYVVKAIRYSGNLLSLLDIRFEQVQPASPPEAPVFISESLWERAFMRRPDILGATLIMHEITYRVAGVTRETSAFLAETEVWLPISGRGAMGAMPCMRIVAALQPGAEWATAQTELTKCFDQFLQDQPYTALPGTRLMPLENGLYFRDSGPLVASAQRVKTRLWSRI